MKDKDYGDLKMAKYYMEENQYDIEEAKKNYLEDFEFERRNSKRLIEM